MHGSLIACPCARGLPLRFRGARALQKYSARANIFQTHPNATKGIPSCRAAADLQQCWASPLRPERDIEMGAGSGHVKSRHDRAGRIHRRDARTGDPPCQRKPAGARQTDLRKCVVVVSATCGSASASGPVVLERRATGTRQRMYRGERCATTRSWSVSSRRWRRGARQRRPSDGTCPPYPRQNLAARSRGIGARTGSYLASLRTFDRCAARVDPCRGSGARTRRRMV